LFYPTRPPVDPFRSTGERPSGFQGGVQPPPAPAKVELTKIETISVDNLIGFPGRRTRPDRAAVIIRGAPGAGKTFVSKLLKVIDEKTDDIQDDKELPKEELPKKT